MEEVEVELLDEKLPYSKQESEVQPEKIRQDDP